MPAINVTHSERIRAINATSSTRKSSPGPRLAVPASAALTRNGASRMSVTPASAPPMVHTMVDTRRTLMPNSLPVSAFSAAARMANPYRVRPRNSAKAAMTSGTMITTMSSRPPIRRWSVTSHRNSWAVSFGGNGNGPGRDTSGSSMAAKMANCATPSVAMNSTNLGESNSRRTTTNSVTMAKPAAAPTDRKNANQ